MSFKQPQYDLSVVIVNYNVEYFLEQCLNAVRSASKELKVQVFVVDNNSIDGSVLMVQEKFPEVTVVANKDNVGFSKANNQAILMSDARYVLLLNPDTVIEEDTFLKTVNFMDEHPESGGLGVRMVDGKGVFLPESKRGFPTPAVSFYKIFGLSRIFPKSKTFGQYHLGYLSEFETNKVDVLSGAFMMLRSEMLDKVGLLDEMFFMYGEDIDLSYRIKLGGYENYYFAGTKIIHYKGESTKKSSVNYVFIFYKAMILFAKKHFSDKNAKLFSLAINLAIYFRASIAIANRFVSKVTLPFFDYVVYLSGLIALTNQWRMKDIHFPHFAYWAIIPIYALVWLISSIFFGVYDKGASKSTIIKSTIIGTIGILTLYALFPKDWQFSRLYILIGSSWVIFANIFIRMLVNLYTNNTFSLPKAPKKRFAILGSEQEYKRVEFILTNTYPNIDIVEGIGLTELYPKAAGLKNQIDQIIDIHKINEIIFCSKELTSKEIIDVMIQVNQREIDFKIAPPETSYLIGSNSIDTSGDLYSLNFNAISKPENLRSKRFVDFIFSLVFIFVSPFVIWKYKNKARFIKNMVQVFLGKKTFVGYFLSQNPNSKNLPHLKKGILRPFNVSKDAEDDSNLFYA
ncbi:MAG: glycosyltransferase, partial [Crocinitomicaceae bacterium]|nr:glycosyltransferase [Crocinitomicaceae bacterium]